MGGNIARLRKYGLTKGEYDKMYNRQGGLCAICKEWMQPANVDHCHDSGKVRGLLCRNCNTGLGAFRDSTRLLAHAMVYLEEHGSADPLWGYLVNSLSEE